MAEAAAALKEQGNAALKSGDAKEALRLYSEALAVTGIDNETAAVLHSNRAAVNSRLGEWPAALADATRCVELRPSWPKAHMRSGAAHYGVGKYAEAEAAYAEALRLAPDDAALTEALADARKAKEKQALEASLMPAVMSFAQRKQAGALLLQEKKYAAAAAEYRGALAAMTELLDKLPANESSPLVEQLGKLRRSMETELLQATQAAQETQPSAPASAPEVPTAPVAPEERVGPLLEELRQTQAGSDTRKELVVELSDLLTAHANNRDVVNEFIDAEGPETVYDIESCMRGNWMADAKNGTMSRLSSLSSIPGPLGLAIAGHRNQRDYRVEAAAAGDHSACQH